MTTTQNDIIDTILDEAGDLPEGATIYIDPNVGGFAWKTTDDSGRLGPDAETYPVEDIINALENDGWRAGHNGAITRRM